MIRQTSGTTVSSHLKQYIKFDLFKHILETSAIVFHYSMIQINLQSIYQKQLLS